MTGRLLLAALACCWGNPVSSAEWLLEPVQVIDVRDGTVLRNQAVLVRGTRIAEIRPAGGPAAGDAERVDGGGGYLMPGLAEMHAHVPGNDPAAQDVLDLFLANGITTIRGMLGQPWHLVLREQLATGHRRGPRLVTSGPSFNGDTVSSPQQGAERVREQAAAGYDFLKIHPGLERDEFQAIAAAARAAGVPIAGHVSWQTGLDAVLAAGQASIDHLDGYAEALVAPTSGLAGQAPQWFGLNLAGGFDDDRIAALASATAAAGVWNVPTQSLFETTAGAMSVESLMARPGMEFLSASLAANWRQRLESVRNGSPAADRARFLATRRALIAALQAHGAGLLLGSDAPQIMNVPGFSVHQELAWLVGAGLSPLQALQSGTTNVAQFFGFEDQGQVMPGMVADFVLLAANPLDDIANTTRILGVAHSGQWHDRATLDRWLAGVLERGL